MNKKVSYIFKIVKKIIKLFYKKMEIVGLEELPDSPCIVVANHVKMNGPLTCELYFPDKKAIWCAGEMMNWKEVPSYSYKDFWSDKPIYSKWFYKLLSYIITPIAVFVFNNASTIEVRRDSRIINTFRDSINALNEGANIIIFPEHDVTYNNIVYEFQENFIHLAKLYHRETNKELFFVPMYIAPTLNKAYLGKPTRFYSDNPIKDEKGRICKYLLDEISNIAYGLPKHKVVPYKNISKKHYVFNDRRER